MNYLTSIYNSARSFTYSKSVTSTPDVDWIEDMLLLIFQNLNLKDLISASLVGKQWSRVYIKALPPHEAKYKILCVLRDKLPIRFKKSPSLDISTWVEKKVKTTFGSTDRERKSLTHYLHLPHDIWAEQLITDIKCSWDSTNEEDEEVSDLKKIIECVSGLEPIYNSQIASRFTELTIASLRISGHNTFQNTIDQNNLYWEEILKAYVASFQDEPKRVINFRGDDRPLSLSFLLSDETPFDKLIKADMVLCQHTFSDLKSLNIRLKSRKFLTIDFLPLKAFQRNCLKLEVVRIFCPEGMLSTNVLDQITKIREEYPNLRIEIHPK